MYQFSNKHEGEIKMQFKNRLIFILLLLFSTSLFCCTTAIITGKNTVDGRPILVKHRDSSFEQNKLMYFSDGKFNYIGLVNSKDVYGDEVWGGSNSAGFAIMNSASYNLKVDSDTTTLVDKEGVIMKLALQQCETLEDFEKLLDELPKPLGVEANFGVIDAKGGCAYYECDNFTYTKIDANNPNIAPFGYIIRTNYSFNGNQDDGYGYIRYLTAEKLFYNAIASNNLDYQFVLQEMSRCLDHSLTDVHLPNEITSRNETKFVPLQDYIVRNSSVSTILVHGVKPDENPDLTTIWTILGFPLTSVATPSWVGAGENLPNCIVADKSGNASLCANSVLLKNKCFPIKRGSGKKYLNLSVVMNKEGEGFYQKIKPFEDEIILNTKARMKKWRSNGHIAKQEALSFYRSLDVSVDTFFRELLSN